MKKRYDYYETRKNENINLNVNNTLIKNLKFIIEVWVFNYEYKQYDFSWESENGNRCAWTQIIFNIGNDR